MNDNNIEVVIDTVYADGSAFIDVGYTTYILETDGKVREACDVDYHPMNLQFNHVHPLCEPGRTFSDFNQAVHYTRALKTIDSMFMMAAIAQDGSLPIDLQTKSNGIFKEIQQEVKDKYLGVLQTVPRFVKHTEKYLRMSPREIAEDMIAKPE